jgi:P4 family phage/plasmid primase-like protien
MPQEEDKKGRAAARRQDKQQALKVSEAVVMLDAQAFSGKLFPHHLADLHKSGLSDPTIAACDFRSLEAPASIQHVLHWKRYRGELGPCLCIPFPDIDGNPTGYCRLKPDRPRKNKDDGRPIKYESPKGASNLPYFPASIPPVLKDATAQLIITEGEKKAAKATQEGFPCIGLVGVWGWQRKRARDQDGKAIGDRHLIGALAAVPWSGRHVLICFDSDAVTNRNVREAEWHLAQVLIREGAIVKVVRLPGGDPGANGSASKVGLDDYLVAHGADAFRELLKTAVNPAPAVAVAPQEAFDDPHKLGRLFVSEHCQHRNELTLRSWREEWRRWDGSAYRELPDAEVTAEVTISVKAEMDRVNLIAQKLAAEKGDKAPAVRKVNTALISNVELALASLTVWPGTVEPPAWYDGKTWQRRNLITLSNGLLDLDALFAGETAVLLPHSPRWFSFQCLPYSFDPSADCPKWLAFLERNLEADRERIALLQEWFGLCLTPDSSRQKFLLLVGEGGNGKSVVCSVLEVVLGAENCSHVPLEIFGKRFQLAPTIGKLANISSEIGELDKAAEGFLKSFTSGDPMQMDRKYKSPIQAVPTARLVLATNNLPRFSDRSSGLWRRMILMPFRVTIDENDPRRIFGMDKPSWWEASGELPGILNWSLMGLDRLRQQDRFTHSKICEDALTEYRTENNPARMFLLESCRESAEGQVPCGDLYRSYRSWCDEHGYSPLAERAFGKEVRRVFPKCERRQVGSREMRLYSYCGITAKPGI